MLLISSSTRLAASARQIHFSHLVKLDKILCSIHLYSILFSSLGPIKNRKFRKQTQKGFLKEYQRSPKGTVSRDFKLQVFLRTQKRIFDFFPKFRISVLRKMPSSRLTTATSDILLYCIRINGLWTV